MGASCSSIEPDTRVEWFARAVRDELMYQGKDDVGSLKLILDHNILQPWMFLEEAGVCDGTGTDCGL